MKEIARKAQVAWITMQRWSLTNIYEEENDKEEPCWKKKKKKNKAWFIGSFEKMLEESTVTCEVKIEMPGVLTLGEDIRDPPLCNISRGVQSGEKRIRNRCSLSIGLSWWTEDVEQNQQQQYRDLISNIYLWEVLKYHVEGWTTSKKQFAFSSKLFENKTGAVFAVIVRHGKMERGVICTRTQMSAGTMAGSFPWIINATINNCDFNLVH